MTEPDDDRSTAMPILIALGVVGLVLLAVIGFRLLRGDSLPAEAGIGRAVIGQNDALQRDSYADYRKFTCAGEQGTENAVLASHRASVQARGARYVDDVRALTIDGDRATATVVYHFEKASDDKITTPMTFVNEAGEWKVCSPGPR